MTTLTATASDPRSDDHFDDLATVVRRRALALKDKRLFRTKVEPLFPIYLSAFAEADRQQHNCHSCRHFLERFGDLAFIGDDGLTEPLLWGDGSDAPASYADSVRAMSNAVRGAAIDGAFLSSEKVWGTAETGEWHHFSIPSLFVFAHPLKTAAQQESSLREEYGMLQRGLAEFPREIVARAVALLDTEVLYRSEKVAGPAKWLLKLHDRRAELKNSRARDNVTWLAVATAPAGFAHVRSSMVGTLLEDLASGMAFDQVSRRFAEKMHPLQYQRPTAAPSDGQIEQAEKIVKQLGTAGSLDRRFANLADIKPLWLPRPKADRPVTEGVFGHLRAEANGAPPPTEIGTPIVITWEKFAREVLPGAEKIECRVPGHGNFTALVTAANPDAPPILQWDHADRRNPVSWYLYSGGSAAQNWGLVGGSFCEVTAISLSPAKWDAERPTPNGPDMAVLILRGAHDMRHGGGGGFFPESLKSDYHAVRKTMEAHARSAVIAGRDEAEACGISLQVSRSPWDITLRVLANGVLALYRPDRWS